MAAWFLYIVNKLRTLKDALQLSNYALAKKIGVNERSIRRWLSGDCLPSSVQLPGIAATLKQELEDATTNATKSATTDATKSASQSTKKESHQAGDERDLIYIENKNKVEASARNNVDNVNNDKSKKRKKLSKSSAVNRDNPCSACPACKEKESRFVDGEGEKSALSYRFNVLRHKYVLALIKSINWLKR